MTEDRNKASDGDTSAPDHPTSSDDGRDRTTDGEETRRSDKDDSGDRDDDTACEGDDVDEDEDQGDAEDEDDRSAREKARDWLKDPKHKLIAIAIAVGLVVALLIALLWWQEARKWQATENAYIRGPIARLSPGVSGNVTQVFVVDNQLVRAGQPLAAISVGSYEVALRQAEAEVETTRAAVLQAQAALVSARAQVRQARATARARDAEALAADREYRRYASLSAGAVAEQQRETGWLPHTTRAALTGLRKRGHVITRSKRDGATCYRIVEAA